MNICVIWTFIIMQNYFRNHNHFKLIKFQFRFVTIKSSAFPDMNLLQRGRSCVEGMHVQWQPPGGRCEFTSKLQPVRVKLHARKCVLSKVLGQTKELHILSSFTRKATELPVFPRRGCTGKGFHLCRL